jgi:hypothetical protein
VGRCGEEGRPRAELGLVSANDCPFVGHEVQFSYQATIDWLVDAIPDATAREKIFGETAQGLYFNGA